MFKRVGFFKPWIKHAVWEDDIWDLPFHLQSKRMEAGPLP